ncbi:helix-turn-helix domain-containing protein [Tenacibaculum sp. 190524A02b]|uniref:helix-turn-helix domain-containing protein n=1 Tax=Tenacibaculum vairaonense TaxID=3137860 RepID=UPI0032B1CB0E
MNSFLKEKSKRFYVENRFFIYFIYINILLMFWGYIDSIVLELTKLLLVNYESYLYISYLLFITVCIYAYKSLIRYNISFSFKEVRKKIFKNRKLIASDKIMDSNSKKEYELLFQLISNDKLFLDPKLSLYKLSLIIEKNEKKVSTLINMYSGVNFNDFINNFRIEEFKKNILKEEYKEYSILGVALESGFSSKSTFYKAFRKSEKMSPKEFLKLL